MSNDKRKAGRELDALVEKKIFGERWTHIAEGKVFDDIPGFSADIAATWKMEEVIEQRGFNLRYAQALMTVLLFDGLEPKCDEELWWALIHASPSQRCRAALKAVKL